MAYNKMIVDPKLFITCRLCLDQMGQYQIVPSVQQQIKFCFDIDVEPFDGLPQLICKDCEIILDKFNETKTKYQEKQRNLKNNSKECNVSSTVQQQDVVTSTEQTEAITTNTSEPKKESIKLTLKKSANLTEVVPESDTCASSYSIVKPNLKRSLKSNKWRNDYNKYFACRFCSRFYKDKKSMPKHMPNHTPMLSQYKHILKECSVTIPKLDNKANITGLHNTIAVDHQTIIQQYNSSCCIVFKRKVKNTPNITKEASEESSDDEIVRHKSSKRKRMLSNSSNETVVLEDALKNDDVSKKPTENDSTKNSGQAENLDCVEIESSESESVENNVKVDGTPATEPAHTSSSDPSKVMIMKNTISTCLNKYLNRKALGGNYKNNKESLLIHKVLSMGTKTISKKELNCTGLLRYMEFKHLDVHWSPRPTNSANCVRVQTKFKKSEVKNETGWQNLSSLIQAKQEAPLHELLEKIHMFEANFSICNTQSADVNNTNDGVIILKNSNEANSNLKFLLNSNPVPNPKLLKKGSSIDNHMLKVISGSPGQTQSKSIKNMPIIMETVSLAQLHKPGENMEAETLRQENSRSSNNVNTEILEPFKPRIKVVPVSQLMPEKSSGSAGLNPSYTQPNNWTTPVPSHISVTDNSVLNLNNCGKENIHQENEEVIMHTVELPNKKTTSPFLYFKTLLQIHNINLLNSNERMTSDFVCLIKFKSIFTQEHKPSVPLDMGLFSNSYQFAVVVKDIVNDSAIDITSLPPHWQWEVLQLYRGDEIILKLLQNAKKIGQKMYDTTNYFIRLLGCIVFRKVNK